MHCAGRRDAIFHASGREANPQRTLYAGGGNLIFFRLHSDLQTIPTDRKRPYCNPWNKPSTNAPSWPGTAVTGRAH